MWTDVGSVNEPTGFKPSSAAAIFGLHNHRGRGPPTEKTPRRNDASASTECSRLSFEKVR